MFILLDDVERAEEYLLLAEREPIEPGAFMTANFRWQWGLIALGRARYDEACRLLRETVDLLLPQSDYSVAMAYVNLAEACVLAGDVDAALDAGQHAVSFFAKVSLSAPLNHAIGVLREAFASKETDRIRTSLNEVRESAGAEPRKYY